MAWSTSRNNYINESAAVDRGKQVIILMKEVLVDTAGWKCVAYGDGTSTSDVDISNGVTPNFPAFPSVTGMGTSIWLALENTSGAQAVFQNDSGGDVAMYWSPSGSYTNDSPTATTRLGGTTPPADEITMQTSYNDWGGGVSAHYMTIAYTSDAESFIAFGQRGGYDERCGFLIKATYAKTGDSYPYVACWRAQNNFDVWDKANLSVTPSGYVEGRHPTNGTKDYALSTIEWDDDDLMDSMPPDPASGDEQLIETIVACPIAGSLHIRGKADGIFRMSGLRSTGDKFDSDRYMGIGDFAIDGWNSTDSLSS